MHLLVYLVVEEEMYSFVCWELCSVVGRFVKMYFKIFRNISLLCLLCSAALLTVEELLAEEAASVIPTAHGAQAENRSH